MESCDLLFIWFPHSQRKTEVVHIHCGNLPHLQALYGKWNDNATSPSNSKSPAQENVANNSATLTEPSDSGTTTSDSTSDLTEIPDVNALLSEALGKLGDNQFDRYLIPEALIVINEWLKRHGFCITFSILHLIIWLFLCPYCPSWPLIYLFPAIKFISLPICGLIFMFIVKPLVSLQHYAPCETYLSLLPVLPACTDATFPCHVPIPIKNLPFQTARFLRPYSSRRYQREKSNFHRLLSVSIHDAVFETSSLILYDVFIPLHLCILTFFWNATKHGRHFCHHCNLPWYSLLFLTFLWIQVPLTYAIPGTNHALVKDKYNWTPSNINTNYKLPPVRLQGIVVILKQLEIHHLLSHNLPLQLSKISITNHSVFSLTPTVNFFIIGIVANRVIVNYTNLL